MSVIEYKYQRATHDQLMKCAKWAMNLLQLRDWKTFLSTEDMPPRRFYGDDGVLTCYGKGYISTDLLRAEIWVNIGFIKKENANPYSTVIHEVVHAFALERAEDVPEQVIMILEPALYRLYCMENKIKIMPEKE